MTEIKLYESDINTKLIEEAKTRRWKVTVQNLNQEQIDFISGPKLLPTISRTDSDATETVNIPQSEEATKEQSTVSLPQHMPEAINSSTTQNAATPSTSNKEADINMESSVDSGRGGTPTKIERPKRRTVKSVLWIRHCEMSFCFWTVTK